MTTEQRLQEIRAMLIGKMIAEHASNTLDATIQQVFEQTVAPEFCIRWAKYFRDNGTLILAE